MTVAGATTSDSSKRIATSDSTDAEDLADIKWDEHYDNPKSDLILLSSDRVGFKVETWTLRKHRYGVSRVPHDKLTDRTVHSQFIQHLLD